MNLDQLLIESQRELIEAQRARIQTLYDALEAARFWIGMQDRQSPELGLQIERALWGETTEAA